jgi:CheY-like chemotaxis protein/HPt (histidine-containing phosphotransfer) domain-containing protein
MSEGLRIERFLATFFAELDTHAAALARGLRALEQGSADRSATLAEVFRAAHTLKAAANAMGIGAAVELCERLERLFSAARGGGAAIAPERAARLREMAEEIGGSGRALAGRRDPAVLDALGRKFAELAAGARDALGEAVASGEAAPVASPPAAAPAARARRLVVADDSPTARTIRGSVLRAAGYDIRVAADGSEVLRLLEDGGADLVVSDLEMPVMNGIELVASLRRSERFSRLPVLLVTGHDDDETRQRARAAGADGYLVKSGGGNRDLLDAVARLLGESDP